MTPPTDGLARRSARSDVAYDATVRDDMDPSSPFFVLHRDLLREGPGSLESTAAALFAVPTLRHRPRILDLGCGPGAQTLDLARLLPDATITAVDRHPPFLEQLRASARAEGMADRITALEGDLRHPPDGPFDLVWSEGAAYFAGFETVLAQWPSRLAPGGAIALTEAVQLVPTLPPAVRAMWNAEYPDLQSVPQRQAQIAEAGLVLHDTFVLGHDAWQAYYGPLQARVDALRPTADAALTKVLDEAQEEIQLFNDHPEAVGYAFFVFGPPDPTDDVEAP